MLHRLAALLPAAEWHHHHHHHLALTPTPRTHCWQLRTAAQDADERTCPAADAVSTVASVRGEQPRLCAAQTCSTLACRRVAPPPRPPLTTNTQDTLPAAHDGSSGRQTRRTCPAADAVSTVASVRGEQPRLCAAQTCSTLACRRVAPPPPPPPPALTQHPGHTAGSSGRQLRTADETHVPSRRCSVDGGVSEGRAATSVCCTDLQHSCLPPSGTTTTTTTTGTDTNTQDTLPAAQDGSSGRQTRRTCPAADAVSTVASVRGEQPRLCAAQTCSTLACRRVAPPPPPPPLALTPTPRTHCRQLRTAAQDGRRDARAQPPMQCRRWRQ